jgi:hypothetical protein
MNNYHTHEDFTYFNVSITNQQNETFAIVAESTQYNTRPIVRDTTNKVISIERINIPTSTIPIFVARLIEPFDPLNPRLIQKIGLEYNGFLSEFNIKFISTGTPNTLGYFHVFTYDIYAKMVNETLEECLTDLGTQTALPIGIEAPYFVFNKESQYFSLVAQKTNYDTDLPNYVKILSNGYFQQKLDGFVFKQQSIVNISPDNVNLFQYLIFDTKDNTYNTNYYKMTQNYNILSEWNSLRAIRIKSNLPINNEFIPLSYAGGQTNSENILKDFTVNYSEFSSVGRTEIVYATNDREYLSLIPHSIITNIYIKVFWIDELGQSNELKLGVFETVNIKFLVKDKDMNY